MRFLDPACGCGNFLVIAYRELRLLEIEVLTALHGGQKQLDIHNLSLVDVDAFYGIEISEWPARIAEVAMWLMDHQMNVKLSEAFGQYFVRLPLKKVAHDRARQCPAARLEGNPAARRVQLRAGQSAVCGKANIRQPNNAPTWTLLLANIKNGGVLDYVTGWYFKAAEYIQGTKIVVGFVSTNSITQGEQVGSLWNPLFQRLRSENSLCPSHFCLGKRSTRESARPCGHHRLCGVRRQRISASTSIKRRR